MFGFKSPESLYEFPAAITHSTPSVSGIHSLHVLGRSFTPSSDFSDDSSIASRPVQKPYTTHGSAIWNYFHKEVDEEGDCSKCCVVLDNGEICNKRKSRHIQVLRNHLKKEHIEIYDRVIAEDLESQRRRDDEKVMKWLKDGKREMKRGGLSGLDRYGFVPDLVKYCEDDARQKLLDETVAIYIGATNAPYSIIDNDHFRIMLGSFDPRYRMPGRVHLNTLLTDVIAKMKRNIQAAMVNAKKIHFCTNIWSKKGLSSSYFGLTAQFYSFTDLKLHSPTLAVHQLPHPHTGEAICDLTYKLIEEWGIPSNKLSFIVTDNGSNMVKAFRIVQCFDETEDLEELEGNIDEEVTDYEGLESKYVDAFKRGGTLVRLSCFSHTLQLVVAKFNKDEQAKSFLSKVHKIVASVSRSGKATEALMEASGKKLITCCITRWSTIYLMVHRMLKVKEHLKKVLLDFDLLMLQSYEWDTLAAVDTLLSKFALYTNMAGAEVNNTILLVVPYYMELRSHLQNMKMVPDITSVSELLLRELDKRFEKLLDHSHSDHNPIYLVATLLDPRYKGILSEDHFSYARRECLRMLLPQADSSSEESQLPAIASQDDVISSGHEGPEMKKPRLLPDMYELMLKKSYQMKESQRFPKLPEIQLDNYIQSTDGAVYEDFFDPILFWMKSTSYTILSPFAIGILSAPAASTAVERTFSTVGEATSGRRNRLTSENLEREVLLKKNKQYYMDE